MPAGENNNIGVSLTKEALLISHLTLVSEVGTLEGSSHFQKRSVVETDNIESTQRRRIAVNVCSELSGKECEGKSNGKHEERADEKKNRCWWGVDVRTKTVEDKAEMDRNGSEASE